MVTVGAMTNRTATAGGGELSCASAGVICANDTLQLTSKDTSVSLRAFVDLNLAECYWQENRVAMMVPAPPTSEASAALLSSAGAGVTVSGVRSLAILSSPPSLSPCSPRSYSRVCFCTQVQAWRVTSPWITQEELLATPHPRQ